MSPYIVSVTESGCQSEFQAEDNRFNQDDERRQWLGWTGKTFPVRVSVPVNLSQSIRALIGERGQNVTDSDHTLDLDGPSTMHCLPT